jgi:hypothetical protein
MSRGLIRSFVVAPKGVNAEERAWLGTASPRTTHPGDYAVDEDSGLLYKLRTAAGIPLRFLGRLLWFAPIVLVAKLVMGAFDRRASDVLVPIFATLVTLFFASVSLWVLLSFIWWVARGRHERKALLVGEPELDQEAFEGIATAIAPGSSVLCVVGADPRAHFGQLEVFAVVRDAGEPIIVVPSRLPRALGAREALAEDLVPKDALMELTGKSLATLELEGVVIRPGDRVRVRGTRVGDVANVESFEIDGAPAGLVVPGNDGAYRQAASQPAILVGDGPTRRLVVEKLGA